MIEKLFSFANADVKTIEKLIDDEEVLINHIILSKDDALPEHYSNSNVYLIVIKGELSLALDDQDIHEYSVGSIVNIPYNTKMNINNSHDNTLEFFVIKAPNPRNYQ